MYSQENLTGRINEKRNYGEIHPAILQYVGKEIQYNKKTIIVESAYGEVVWLTIKDSKGRAIAYDYECNQSKILEIIEKQESEKEKDKAKSAETFALEFEKYRQSKKSA